MLDGEFKKISIASATCSPDSKLPALGCGGEADGKIFLIDPATSKKIRDLTPSHPAMPNKIIEKDRANLSRFRAFPALFRESTHSP